MRNIVITTPTYGNFDQTAFGRLETAGYEYRAVTKGGATEQQVMDMIDQETVAIITGLEPITAAVQKKSAALKVVAKHGIGVDNIDLAAAKQLGIRVINAPTTSGDSVADLAFGLMLALARKIPAADAQVKGGAWPKLFGTGVWGKTCGIFGFGSIGKKLALRARGFNMTVLAYDPYFDDAFAAEHGVVRAEPDAILKEADFISMHLPLLPSTRNFISEPELKKMKHTACIVNTARGGVIDEQALLKALKEGIIAGAALDVFSAEPPKHLDICSAPNLITTPHVGGYTDDALRATSSFVCDALLKVLQGESVSCFIV